MKIEEGLPNPLGATWDGRGTNFALFSANATKVEVCIFDNFDGKETSRTELPNTPTKSFTDFCPTSAPARSMAFVFMARTIQNRDTVSIRTSCFSIPMREPMPANSNGIPRFLDTTWSQATT
jgi:pullulanase/glycogen debranching enzyme